MSKKILIITGDYNDADYVTRQYTVSNKELTDLEPIIKKMKKYKEGNHLDNWKEKYEDLLTEEELDLIDSYIPYGPEGEVHTIESIKLLIVLSETTLL